MNNDGGGGRREDIASATLLGRGHQTTARGPDPARDVSSSGPPTVPGCQSCHFWSTSHPTWMNWTWNFRERITSSVISTESKDCGESSLFEEQLEREFFLIFTVSKSFALQSPKTSTSIFWKRLFVTWRRIFWRDFQILTELRVTFFCSRVRLIVTLNDDVPV